MQAGERSKLAIAWLCLLGTLLAMLVCAGVALASRGHEFTGSFAKQCVAPEACTGELLSKPNGVAVNEATGDVYVVDEGEEGAAHGRVVRFNAKGVVQSEFNGSGLLLGEGIEAGSGVVPGEVKTGRFEKPQTIAVDNSCVLRKLAEPKCKEEDPSNGDVYVVDAGHTVIDKYTAGGEYVGQITANEVGRFERALEGVAVDQEGHVFVLEENEVMSVFTNATPNAPSSHASVTPSPLLARPLRPGFVRTAEGQLYVRYGDGTRDRIARIPEPSGNVLVTELDNEFSSAVAVDPTNANALVDNLTTLAVFGPDNGLVERLGKEGGVEHLTAGAGVGVNAGAGSSEGSGSIYVADAAKGDVVVFGPQSPSPPQIESESIANVGASSASLGAQINPRSQASEEATKYRFVYGACASLSQCPQSGYGEVLGSAGQIAPDFLGHAVSASLSGLQANTTYHFKVLAENAKDLGHPSEGEERTFTTEGAGGNLTLPDNRGFELVSPPDKKGANIEPISESGVIQAAAGGNAITYLANAPTEAQPEGSTNLVQVLSRRAGASWSSADIAIAHTSATGFAVGNGQEYKFFDSELGLSAVQPFGEFIPQLSAEASESTAYLHDLSGSCASSCFHPLVTGKPGFANVPQATHFGEEGSCKPRSGAGYQVACGPALLGATEDLRHIVLRSPSVLVAGFDSHGKEGLYEWSAGTLSPVSVLPGGEAATSESGLGDVAQGAARGAISKDGARIAWETSETLYLRDMTRSETVQLDKAGCEKPEEEKKECNSGAGVFQFASADGSRVFFTDINRLTKDAGANPKAARGAIADLYECKLALGAPKLGCELTDLTPKHGEESADVRGSVLGSSADGSSIYFVARGVQSQAPNDRGQSAIAGQPNLYVHRDGAGSEFIATLSGGDETDWDEIIGGPGRLSAQPTRVSASGRYLALMSQASPTGYDNRDVASNKPVAEVYLYDAEAKHLTCASCEPTGARPTGIEYHKLEPGSGGLAGGPRDIWPVSSLVAANVPGWTAIDPSKARYQPRYLNEEGRLFFNSADALVPQDTNGIEDVYQYEPPGVGSCSQQDETYSARSGGCVSLISSGRSAQESAFLDASETGNDVFFLTAERLSSLDNDNALDVYDAHVCSSGSPCITFPTVQSPPCDEPSCKGSPTPQPSIFAAPASATFSGPANPPPASPSPPKPKSAEQIRIERLHKALKACHAKKNKHKRQACEKQARKRYAARKASAKAHKSAGKSKSRS